MARGNEKRHSAWRKADSVPLKEERNEQAEGQGGREGRVEKNGVSGEKFLVL